MASVRRPHCVALKAALPGATPMLPARAALGARKAAVLHSAMTSCSAAGVSSQRCLLGRYNVQASRRPVPIVVAQAAAVAAAGGQDLPSSRFSATFAQPRFSPWALTSSFDKEIWGVALPALVAMLLEPVMGAINAALVGHLGTMQLSAVGMGTLAVSFCSFLFSFLLFLTVPEIAAAAVKKDHDEVSRIAGKSLWVGLACGVMTTVVLLGAAQPIVALLNPPEPMVAMYAQQFIQVRAWGITAALLSFVATGVFRGFKDTRTPLYAACASAAASLGLNLLLLKVLHWGVAGSALATTCAQWVTCAMLLGALGRSGKVQWRHLASPPSLASVLPTLRLGAVLGMRNVISFGMVLYSSALCIQSGSTYQAAFEVLRQLWVLTIQFFECLNVATQSLGAHYLGKRDTASARDIMARMMALGTGIGAAAGAIVYCWQGPLIRFFTSDAAVIHQASVALPLLCAFFPLDAIASIFDGSLLAAKQSNYMSATQIAGALVQYVALAYLATNHMTAPVYVWAALKIMSIVRVISGAWRTYGSDHSAYMVREPAAAAAVQHQQQQRHEGAAAGVRALKPAAAHEVEASGRAADVGRHAVPVPAYAVSLNGNGVGHDGLQQRHDSGSGSSDGVASPTSSSSVLRSREEALTAAAAASSPSALTSSASTSASGLLHAAAVSNDMLVHGRAANSLAAELLGTSGGGRPVGQDEPCATDMLASGEFCESDAAALACASASGATEVNGELLAALHTRRKEVVVQAPS